MGRDQGKRGCFVCLNSTSRVVPLDCFMGHRCQAPEGSFPRVAGEEAEGLGASPDPTLPFRSASFSLPALP